MINVAGGIQLSRVSFSFVFLIFCQLVVDEVRADTTTILAFGDSITQGLKRDAGGTIWGIQYVPQGARVGGYEPYLEQEFRSNGLAAYVHNWGYTGERTTTGLSRLQSIVSSHSGVYDYCLLMEGANDLYAGINANTTAFNLGVMADTCRNSGVVPIMTTITPNTYLSRGSDIETFYNPAIESIASGKNVTLVDQYGAVRPNWSSLNSGDGLHLNSAGDQVMAKEWFTVLGGGQGLPGVYLLLLAH